MTAPTQDATAARNAPSPSAGYGRYVLSMLLVINFLAFLDRQILNILAEPIKQELELSDTQIGLLTGLAFAFLYTFLGLPIARLAERTNRVGIIGISLAIWSGFTVACGFAGSYVQLALARVGVGVGEAGCSPASHSLISDYVPREKRASALGFYSMGVPLGTMAGLAFGGLIADAYGWRIAIVVAGAPGLLIAVLAKLTIKDIRRQRPANRGPNGDAAPSLGQAMRELASKRAFWWATLAASSSAFLAYGHNAFYASFFLRNHAPGVAEIAATVSGGSLKASGFLGIALGLILGLGGLLGSFLGGRMCDHFAKRDPRANALLPAGAFLISLPFVIGAVFIPNTAAALLMLGPAILLKTFWYGPIFAMVQNVVEPCTRATAAAILLGMMNLIGLGLGPVTVGIFSDAFATTLGTSEGLRWGLAVTAIMGIVPPACLWMASKTLIAETVDDHPDAT